MSEENTQLTNQESPDQEKPDQVQLIQKQILPDNSGNINLILNRSDDGETTIDLSRVFHNMKVMKSLYAWILILCMVIGLCVPLVMYQVNKEPLTVYSVVTLCYDVISETSTDPVEDLTAPDGEDLDLSQITSSYVLQDVLSNMELSQPITMSNLRSNISIRQILTEDSSRQQEILNAMLENNSSAAYDQMAGIQTNYTKTFIVSLTNGFGNEDSRTKLMLKDEELKQLLDQILDSYNDYLGKTYLDKALPEDVVSVINVETMDIPECVDQLRTAMMTLYEYCDSKSDQVRNYRSSDTGYSLNDLMKNLQLIQEVDVEYLSAYVFYNGIANDRDSVIDNYKYNLMSAQTALEQINDSIAAVESLLINYKNDEILVSLTESDDVQTATANTDYYNNLLLAQADYEKDAAAQEERIEEMKTRISALENSVNTVTQDSIEEAQEELDRLLDSCQQYYERIKTQMEEVFSSSFYNYMIDHSNALGKEQSFLSQTSKKMITGIVAGAVIGLAIWFLGGLIPELSHEKRKKSDDPDEMDKEVQAS